MDKWFKILICLILIFNNQFLFCQESEDDSPKLKKEIKISEVVQTDSLPAAELLKRAVNWIKLESARYGKTNGIATGSKAECTITFHVKPKELNPVCDYEGKVIMKVTIECKNSKYRYSIHDIKHLSDNGRTSAGSVDNLIPECGTMIMIDLIWKKLKGEAIAKANSLVNEIKEGMKIKSDAGSNEW